MQASDLKEQGIIHLILRVIKLWIKLLHDAKIELVTKTSTNVLPASFVIKLKRCLTLLATTAMTGCLPPLLVNSWSQ